MIRILVTGGCGQLAQALAATQGKFKNMHVAFEAKQSLDITRLADLRAYLAKNSVDYVINCAAYTHVDQAEQERAQAYTLNTVAATYLAALAQEQRFTLWHISTDYVFGGNRAYPYSEDMPTHPVNYYGETKMLGEQKILATHPGAYIIRTGWLYRAVGNNFLTRFLRQAQKKSPITMAYDRIGSPTYADDLAQSIWHMLQQHYQEPHAYMPGIYHYTNEGLASRYDFAWVIKHYIGLPCILEPGLTKHVASVAQRPAYSVLNTAKIKTVFGLRIAHWQDSLIRCLQHVDKGL
jgi:dTDP-4-dehydrorhamnose reductase